MFYYGPNSKASGSPYTKMIPGWFRSSIDAPSRTFKEPIAIVGIGCRFPGASSLESLWHLLCENSEAVREIPPDRADFASYYDPTPATPGKLITRRGGFLDGIDRFDPYFFGISPREAERIDPQQRLLLEVAWEALENAGLRRDEWTGSRTGVFMGVWTSDYESCMFKAANDIDLFTTTGGGRYAASGRLSYAFDLRGPSLTVDTACSSSLVAVHLACQSLNARESELALAGGVNLLIQPHISIGYSRARMLSADGRCKFGDAAADGYVRSEGAGVVVLKLLSRALADCDPIHAVIRGSAVNNDGHSSGLLVAPSPETQKEVLRQALSDAGIHPGEIDYMEAHGTGTQAGDPVELEALAAVLGEGRTRGHRCQLGSVKTNIGHTEAASGVAGLIKTVLVLQHRLVPGNRNFRQPNPRIPWDSLPLEMQCELGPLRAASGMALAGVNSFGITGTNAHIVLQEAPPPSSANSQFALFANSSDFHLLPLSAHSPEALQARARDFAALLRSETPPDLRILCYTTALRRTHHEYRLATVGLNRAEIAGQLDAFVRGESTPGLSSGLAVPGTAHRIAFVFPGQGSQWFGMARSLMANELVFRQTLERCENALANYVDWRLLDQLSAESSSSSLPRVDVIQPLLFSIEVAFAELWRSWGIEPHGVVGHSMGELAAAYISGVLSLDHAACIICRRSHLLRPLSGRGAMAMVDLSFEQAQRALSGFEDRVSIAANNGMRSTVLSGDPEAIDELLARFERQEIFCRRVNVDVASHSPQMDPLCGRLLDAVSGVTPHTAAVPIYSTVTGARAYGPEFVPHYWVDNLRKPVLFSSAVQALLNDGCDIFIEMSPHPILLPAISQGLLHAKQRALTLPSMRRNEPGESVMLESLGSLYCQGYPIQWQRSYPVRMPPVSLPSYPWQRERFWYRADDAAREANQPDSGISSLFYEVVWRPENPVPQNSAPSVAPTGTWLLFADRKGIAKSLADRLQVLGDGCLLVYPDDLAVHTVVASSDSASASKQAFTNLLSGLLTQESRNFRGLLYLWPLDTPSQPSADVFSVSVQNCLTLLGLVQALSAIRSGDARHVPPLWVVTNGVNRVASSDLSLNLDQSPLWGLARVIANELPEFRCGRVDLSSAISEQEIFAFGADLQSSRYTDEVSYRAEARYVSRLEKKTAAAVRSFGAGSSAQAPDANAGGHKSPATSFRNWSEGSYVITGGLGGIGIELANWLVCQGATSLVLTGRKKAPDHLRPLLNKMKAAGVHILEAPADVSRLDQVEELFDHIAQNLPPLRGIFHAAGVLEDGVLLQLDDNRFRAVCAPKIAGAWNLHSLTLKYPVDLFVMFSSAMALLGSPGQGNYAAANAFLDALAHHRRALGMPGLSVNWGPWSGIGLAAAQTNRGERLAQRGLAAVEPAMAMEALGRLLAADRAQFAVMVLDFPLWSEYNPNAASSSFFGDLRGTRNHAAATSETRPAVSVSVRSSALALPPGKQRRMFLEGQIKEQISNVLKIPPARLDLTTPLKSMGLDSLMALELRNRLEAALDLTLPAALIWNYPTVVQLATHLAEKMNIQLEEQPLSRPLPQSQLADVDSETDLDQALAEIEQLSEEEVSRRVSQQPG